MITRLKCVLLDDELPGLTYLKMLCEQIPEVEVVKAFNDPQKFLTALNTLDFDLCILDIEMPKINGMQVALSLKDKQIIFATAYRQYAADAFDLDAADFIGKPVTRERLETAINKALGKKKLKDQNKQLIQLNTDKGKALIEIASIAYITTSEVDSRDKVTVMLDQSSVVLKNISFETLQAQLPAHQFCRINKKQVISVKIISSYTHNEIKTIFNQGPVPMSFPVSEVFRQEFQKIVKGIS